MPTIRAYICMYVFMYVNAIDVLRCSEEGSKKSNNFQSSQEKENENETVYAGNQLKCGQEKRCIQIQ